jgi:hypothetical protein
MRSLLSLALILTPPCFALAFAGCGDEGFAAHGELGNPGKTDSGARVSAKDETGTDCTLANPEISEVGGPETSDCAPLLDGSSCTDYEPYFCWEVDPFGCPDPSAYYCAENDSTSNGSDEMCTYVGGATQCPLLDPILCCPPGAPDAGACACTDHLVNGNDCFTTSGGYCCNVDGGVVSDCGEAGSPSTPQFCSPTGGTVTFL